MKRSMAWRQFEYRCSELLSGVRNAFSGAKPEQTGSSADVRHKYLYIEAKYRKRHAVVRVWDAARKKADHEGKIPIVALAERGRHGCFLLLYSGDLERLSKAGTTNDLPLFTEGA